MPASEKSAEDLFFVQSVNNDDSISTSISSLTRKGLRSKLLRSEVNLQPNPLIKGFPSQERKITRKKSVNGSRGKPLASVDSSSDEEFNKSVSYKAIRSEYDNRLAARTKQHPAKPTVHVPCKDLWDEGVYCRYPVLVNHWQDLYRVYFLCVICRA